MEVALRENRIDGLFRHGVDRVRASQLRYVQGGWVLRILYAGRSPQWTLEVGAFGQVGVVKQGVLEKSIGALRIGDARLAPQCQSNLAANSFQALIHFGIQTGNKEGSHGMNGGDVLACFGGTLEASTESLNDIAVAIYGENKGDVDADSLCQGIFDGREGTGGGRNLDHDIGTINLGPELTRLLKGGVSVIRNARVDLDGHAAICAVRRGINICKEAASILDVLNSQCVHRLIRGSLGFLQRGKLGVVGGAVGHRCGENSRVGGNSHDGLRGNYLLEIARY